MGLIARPQSTAIPWRGKHDMWPMARPLSIASPWRQPPTLPAAAPESLAPEMKSSPCRPARASHAHHRCRLCATVAGDAVTVTSERLAELSPAWPQ